MSKQAYEMVIGLEVHVELQTHTKIFCGCKTAFDAPPNTQVCPVCMGLPGALPVLNREVITLAARAGLATHCHIANECVQDRKNYFYPDLPKAYQVSQYDRPLCTGGWLDVETDAGVRRIGITRIHIEEDAGKLLHEATGTRIDLNRCGVPLIELVTEPDIRSAAEAKVFLQKLRAILRCAGVSDCRMNEGQMRCDVNLSIRKPGDALGTRTEMKNLNSFAFAAKAIEYEYARQVEAVSKGEVIVQETRRFDPTTGKTYTMRTKENADDYRYFPDPDLPPIRLTDGEIDAIRQSLPELPDARAARLQKTYCITAREAGTLCGQPPLADAFEAEAPRCQEPLRLCNLLVEEASRLLSGDDPLPYVPGALAELCNLLADGTIHLGAAKRVLQEMRDTAEAPTAIVEALGLSQISDITHLTRVVEQVLLENRPLVDSYLAGKTKALQAIMGKIMAVTDGRANPAMAAEILQKKISQTP